MRSVHVSIQDVFDYRCHINSIVVLIDIVWPAMTIPSCSNLTCILIFKKQRWAFYWVLQDQQLLAPSQFPSFSSSSCSHQMTIKIDVLCSVLCLHHIPPPPIRVKPWSGIIQCTGFNLYYVVKTLKIILCIPSRPTDKKRQIIQVRKLLGSRNTKITSITWFKDSDHNIVLMQPTRFCECGNLVSEPLSKYVCDPLAKWICPNCFF